MCLPIELGKLGIRNVVFFNQALLGKWLCRYGHEVTHQWQRVISTKYGEGQGGWSTKVCRRAHECGLWQSIHEGWENFSKHLSFAVGEGTHIVISVSSMIGGLVIIPLNFSILSSTFVQLTRKLVFLRFCGFRREYY